MKDDNKTLWAVLKMLAPGTVLRDGLENILKAKTGGLVVLSDSVEVRRIVEGGFLIEDSVSAARLYELAKMDGAIILDEKGEYIWKANGNLQPSVDVVADETGIRHRVAARTAVQTGAVVVAISQRRSIITVYYNQKKFVLMDVEALLVRSNQALKTLERYVAEMKQDFEALSLLEFDNLVTVNDVVRIVQGGELVKRIVDEIDFYLIQMGVEGRFVAMQKQELANEILAEYRNVIGDYAADFDKKTVNDVMSSLSGLDDREIMDKSTVAKVFGFTGSGVLEQIIVPRGCRILGRVPRLPQSIIHNVMKHFEGSFGRIITAAEKEFTEVEGIGSVRARTIYRSLQRQREYAIASGHPRF